MGHIIQLVTFSIVEKKSVTDALYTTSPILALQGHELTTYIVSPYILLQKVVEKNTRKSIIFFLSLTPDSKFRKKKKKSLVPPFTISGYQAFNKYYNHAEYY